MISLAVAEDKEFYRKFLVNYLVKNGFNLSIEAKNGKDLINKLKKNVLPDVVLLDLWMPEMDGFETARQLMTINSETRIIVLTSLTDPSHVINMYKLGIKSFVWKDKQEEIIRAINVVHSGGFYFPEEIGQVIQRKLNEESESVCPFVINDNELALVRMICQGMSSRVIGKRIGKSHRTVEDYREKLYQKFEVTTKEEFVAKAVKWQIF